MTSLDSAYNPMRIARFTNAALFFAAALVAFVEIGTDGPILYGAAVVVAVTLVAAMVIQSVESRPVPPSETTSRAKGFPVKLKEKK